MKLVIFILMFFILGALVIISNNNIAMIKSENFGVFKGLYLDWVGSLYFNFQKITGEVVKLEWIPHNYSE